MTPETHCTASSKSTGKPCKKTAIPGGTVCRFHGGGAPQVRRAATRRVAIHEITLEAARLGRQVDTTPLDAILEMVQEAAANVHAIRLALDHLTIEVRSDGLGIAVPSNYDEKGRRDPALPHILVSMYDAERDRLVKYSKIALDAGIDQKRIELAEEQAHKLGQVIEAAVRALNPSPEEYRRALDAAAATLRALNSTNA